jgi:hypothetical protein
MTVERAKWVAIVALFFVDVAVFCIGYQVGVNNTQQDAVVQVECNHEDR